MIVLPLEHQVLVYIALLAALTEGGTWFCRGILAAAGIPISPPAPPPDAEGGPALPNDDHAKAGRFIGIFERLIILIGLAAQSWEVMAAVIALKTVARYKELERQIRAEYFLLGSLASLLWAILMSIALLWFDRALGSQLADLLLSPLQSR